MFKHIVNNPTKGLSISIYPFDLYSFENIHINPMYYNFDTLRRKQAINLMTYHDKSYKNSNILNWSANGH